MSARFEPIQLVNKGNLSEKLQDVKLFSGQHPEGLLITLENCIRVRNASVPRGAAVRIGLFNREVQDVQGKVAKFLYRINRNTGEVSDVYGIKLTDGRELVFTDDAYSHQAATNFEDVQIMPCPNGGRRKHKSVKRRRTHKRKTHRRRKY